MCGLELSQLLRIEPEWGRDSPLMMPEHALEEISAQTRIFEPSFLCHRKVVPPPDEHAGKDANAVSRRAFVLAEDLDPLHTAARGSPFEDESIEAGLLQLIDLFTGVSFHPLGQLIARYGLDEPRVVASVDETNRGSRHAEPELDLRAHRYPFEPPVDHIREIAIVLVAAVVSNLGAEEA